MTDGQKPSLVWGIKASFRSYVESLPDGVISVEAGAQSREDGTFAFPIHGAPHSFRDASIESEGRVVMTGHSGMLRVTLERPRLRLHDGVAELSIKQGRREVVVAVGSTEEQSVDGRAVLSITAAGSIWLGDQYSVGSELDPIFVDGLPLGSATTGVVAESTTR